MMTQWHALGRTEVLLRLKSAEGGLTNDEAAKRLLIHGKNILPQKKATSAARIFFQQFINPLIAILLVAAVITLYLHEFADTMVIGITLVLNVIIGFVQEYKAERALVSLLHIIAEEATVLREGHRQRIPREDIVPGDVIVLSSGSRVSADIRLLDVHECEIDEAILTGESLPQHKTVPRTHDHRRLGEITNMAYAGTVVTRGNAMGVVVATGQGTEVGKIAQELAENENEQTPLQEKLSVFSQWLSFIVLGLAVLVFFVGAFSGRSLLEMFKISVALAVAAIPEGLVVGVTAILAIGMHRLVQNKAVVRRLLAAEILGSTTVICTDKTGTLTEGDMRLVRIVTLDHDFDCAEDTAMPDDIKHILLVGVLVNESVVEEKEGDVHVFGSPTERGIALGGIHLGIQKTVLLHQQRIIDVFPFNSEERLAATLHEPHTAASWRMVRGEQGKGRILSVLGAPDRLLALSSDVLYRGERHRFTPVLRARLEETIRLFGERGWRVVGVAERAYPDDMKRVTNVEEQYSDLTFGGLLVLRDPLRQGVAAMVEKAKRAGIATVLVTGDHRATASSIAKEVGLPVAHRNILRGEELAALTPHALAERVKEISVYARVVPHEKVRIVEAWQKLGAVVAMTGDGVNDAPALRRADIGVAVGTATDVAKEAADLVILDNNFGTIVRAVEEGRVIMDNVRKLILYLLSDGLTEIILIVSALLLDWPLPLLATQILWINLVTDGLPNLALTIDPGEKGVMEEKPIPRNAPLLDHERRLLILFISLLTGLANLGLFAFIMNVTGDVAHARNVIFVSLGIETLLYVFSCRTIRKPLWRSSPFSNRYLLLAVVGGVALQIMAISVPFFRELLQTAPLSFQEWIIVGILSFTVIVLIEAVKGIFLWKKNHV